jgi:hypothetical protein
VTLQRSMPLSALPLGLWKTVHRSAQACHGRAFAFVQICPVERKLDKKAAGGTATFTTAPVAASCGVDPEFVDLPGLETKFGVKRSLAYVLISQGAIRSVVLRRRGTIKGKRLVDCASVRAFLASQPTDVDPQLAANCRKANRIMREKEETKRKVDNDLAAKKSAAARLIVRSRTAIHR